MTTLHTPQLMCSLLIGNWYQHSKYPQAEGWFHPRYQREGQLSSDLHAAYKGGCRSFLLRHPRGGRTHPSIHGKGYGMHAPLSHDLHPELAEFMEWALEEHPNIPPEDACTFVAYEGSANIHVVGDDAAPVHFKDGTGSHREYWRRLAKLYAEAGFHGLAIDSFPKAQNEAVGGVENGCELLARAVENGGPELEFYAEPMHNIRDVCPPHWSAVQFVDQAKAHLSLYEALGYYSPPQNPKPILILGAGDDPKEPNDFRDIGDERVKRVEQRIIRHGCHVATPYWLRSWT